jgi:hypothetical protein
VLIDEVIDVGATEAKLPRHLGATQSAGTHLIVDEILGQPEVVTNFVHSQEPIGRLTSGSVVMMAFAERRRASFWVATVHG